MAGIDGKVKKKSLTEYEVLVYSEIIQIDKGWKHKEKEIHLADGVLHIPKLRVLIFKDFNIQNNDFNKILLSLYNKNYINLFQAEIKEDGILIDSFGNEMAWLKRVKRHK